MAERLSGLEFDRDAAWKIAVLLFKVDPISLVSMGVPCEV
jgi:hypothetical protein